MRRFLVAPAVFVGSLLVILIGTSAARRLPSGELVEPSLSAASLKTTQVISASSQNQALAYSDNEPITCSLPDTYPAEIVQWCSLIESASETTGLPADLIAAVMLQESGGDPLSYSSSGAVGLMQVMPRDGQAATFMCINGPCFADRPSMQELFNPQFNVAYGSQLLAGLIQRNGSVREGLRAYGPRDSGYSYADLVLQHYNNY